MQVVIADQIFDVFDGEGDVDADADGADGQELDDAFDADAAVGADAFEGRQAHHLGAVEEELARAALAGVDDELGDGLAEELADGLAGHLVGDVEGIDIDHLAGVALHFRQRRFPVGSSELFRGSDHTCGKIRPGARKVQGPVGSRCEPVG